MRPLSRDGDPGLIRGLGVDLAVDGVEAYLAEVDGFTSVGVRIVSLVSRPLRALSLWYVRTSADNSRDLQDPDQRSEPVAVRNLLVTLRRMVSSLKCAERPRSDLQRARAGDGTPMPVGPCGQAAEVRFVKTGSSALAQ